MMRFEDHHTGSLSISESRKCSLYFHSICFHFSFPLATSSSSFINIFIAMSKPLTTTLRVEWPADECYCWCWCSSSSSCCCCLCFCWFSSSSCWHSAFSVRFSMYRTENSQYALRILRIHNLVHSYLIARRCTCSCAIVVNRNFELKLLIIIYIREQQQRELVQFMLVHTQNFPSWWFLFSFRDISLEFGVHTLHMRQFVGAYWALNVIHMYTMQWNEQNKSSTYFMDAATRKWIECRDITSHIILTLEHTIWELC